MNTEHELFGELHEQEEYGLFGNEHRRQYDAQQEALCLSAVSDSGLVEKGLAYWIFYEDGHTFYCKNCIDKRVEEINTNKEFLEDIDYDGGDTCGYYQGWADQDCEVECCKCSASLLSNIDDV